MGSRDARSPVPTGARYHGSGITGELRSPVPLLRVLCTGPFPSAGNLFLLAFFAPIPFGERVALKLEEIH